MKKITSLFILLLLFVQLVGFVFAQDTSRSEDTSLVVPRIDNSAREQEIVEFAAERAQKLFLFNTALWIAVGLSLILGFFITKRMIKTNPKITNWIIHIIIELTSLTVLTWTLIDGIRCLNSQYCGFPSIYYFIWIATLFSTIFSISIIRGLIKKRTNKRYSTNMSSSTIFMWIIFIILTPIAELIVRPNFDIPAFLILPFSSGVIVFALYFVLGIIGYFIDKHKDKF